MRIALKTLAGIAAVAVLGSAFVVAVPELLSLEATVGPVYERILLGVGVFALLCIAYGNLDRKPSPQVLPVVPEPKKVEPPMSVEPGTTSAPGLEAAYRQLRTYIDLEMWELALDKANHIRANHPQSREATAIERNINELRWKAEPKFVAREKTTVSDTEERRLRTEGLSRSVQHIRTYMELEMWELAKQKASALVKNFPESDAAKEAGLLWPEIERKLKEPTETVASR